MAEPKSVDQLVDVMSDSTGAVCKKRPRRSFVRRVCLCDGTDKCFKLMEQLYAYDPSRCGWYRLTKAVKGDTASAKSKRKLRQVTLNHLGGTAKALAANKSISPNTSLCFAWIHMHPDIHRLATSANGRLMRPKSVPQDLALRLREQGCDISDNDKLLDNSGDYFAVPNYKHSAAVAELQRLQATAGHGGGGAAAAAINSDAGQGPLKRRVRPPPRLHERRAAERASLSPGGAGAENAALRASIKALEDQVRAAEARATAAEAREGQAKARARAQAKADAEAAYERTLIDRGGLNRPNISDPGWHRANPEAARHLFGFSSWDETRRYLWAFWPDLKAPTFSLGESVSERAITPFEQCLIAKMRIHRGMPLETLHLIWGRKENTISEYVTEWVPKWGEVGEDLSILDITPAYLRATMPEKHKAEGLEKICAVPDGKDFMIDTPRSNALLTRACRSEKVHHSAVRCISWSTAGGLSFEHTDLFLARVSEKRLVELWGPRLKKCPPGWEMLSDRGFAGTARYYPNFNAQLTPKFLSGRLQFTADEVSADWRICKLRYTCEVAFSRVTCEVGLKDVITAPFFKLLNAMNHVGHANVNLMKPLIT